MKWRKYISGIIWLFLLLGFDQLTKWLAVKHLKNQEAFPVIRDIFELEYLENHGAAFGMFQNQRVFLLLFTIIILSLVVFLYLKLPFEKKYLPLRWSGILIGAGAVGNMIDRITLGYVVDFFYFKWINFPIFNVADCYVVIAASVSFFLICFYYKDEDFAFLKKKHGKKEEI